MPKILKLLLAFFLFSEVGAVQQAVTVKGIVNCRGHRQPGTFVQLYDEDSVFDSDDLLGSVIADHRGVFCVKGATEEFTTIEPYVFIEHNCGYEGLNEKRVFSKMIPIEYITEGPKAKHVYHMGDIELLTADAPVQNYEKRIYVETNIDERIRQCIPIYVQYKRFYEKTIFETKTHETILPTDEEVPAEIEEPVVEPTEGDDGIAEVVEETQETEEPVVHEVSDEEKRLEEERLRLEEEQKRLDEIRRLQEESLRLEEIRRIEEEKKRIEETRRQEEEQQRIELERREEERRLENERRAEEERKREEEAKLQEQRRKEQEEEHKRRMEEYHRREQERQEALKRREEELKRREEEEKGRIVSSSEKVEKKDPCVHYPVLTQSQSISRSLEARHEYVEDPCLRK
ncbi:CRE-TTR-14 protein [Caenorhabditis remanei]|uniref:CRE-TTR-14 protein n=1 Tax=Caenorhabditis remanei TaxID=31234 RepID=E3M248_CAERE|nr:CRE-TTR-14 protein [Caenorhabditis remanei]